MKQMPELEYLQEFYERSVCCFGPASADVRWDIYESILEDAGFDKAPEGYDLREFIEIAERVGL